MLNSLLEMLLPTGPKRRLRRLLAEGEELTGRIDAIRVKSRSESPDFWEYGIECGGHRYGIRQWLEPGRGIAGLGAEVVLRRLDEDVVIDWPATLGRIGIEAGGTSVGSWKMLHPPPPPGLSGVTEEQIARRARLPEE